MSRDESSSFERKVPAVNIDGSRGSARYCKKDRDKRASETERDAASKRVRQDQTSCYILEEHSNSDMKREARSVNEDPRGNAFGNEKQRERERGEELYIRTLRGNVDEREKERDQAEWKRGAKQRTAERGGESRGASLFLVSTHEPSDSVRSPRSPSFICLASSAWEADPN